MPDILTPEVLDELERAHEEYWDAAMHECHALPHETVELGKVERLQKEFRLMLECYAPALLAAARRGMEREKTDV